MFKPSLLFRPFALVALLSFSAVAHAQADKPVTMLVPFAAGGSTDILARLLGKEMGDLLKRPIVVDNKPGAEGFIAAQALKNAKPDGSTIMMVTTSVYAINPAIFSSVPYDSTKDFSTVALVATSPNVLLVPGNSPFKTLADVVGKASASKGAVSYATGATMHLLNAKWLEALSSTEMVSVPYKGSAGAYPDLISGRVDFMFDQPLSSMPFVKDGKLRVVAVTSAERWQQLPDVPTVAEQGFPSFSTTSWWAILAPSGTPESTVKTLHEAIQAALRRPSVLEKVKEIGADVASHSLPEAQRYTADELRKWKDVAAAAKVQLK